MVTEVTKKIGKYDCRFCRREVNVRENARGTLNASCPECDVSVHAKIGTEARRNIMSWLRKVEVPDIPIKPVAATASTGAPSREDAPVEAVKKQSQAPEVQKKPGLGFFS